MKNNNSGIFRRIGILVFCIITILSVFFIIITYLASTYFYKASTQLLNKDVAAHIAKFTSPFETNSIDKKKADSVFYNAMVVNPSIEVYFLNTSGKVMYYQSPDTAIQLKTIPLDDIQKFINSGGEKYITSYDPKHAGVKKTFSAAPVYKHNKLLGYIYVILGSSEYGNAKSMLFGSQVWHLALEAFIIVIMLTILISIYYIRRLQHNYKKILDILEEYKKGNYNVQFALKDSNEFAPITEAFNRITALLSSNMKRLQRSETERKDFIATISHDLQSPLSVARGYAETMLIQNNSAISSEYKEYIKLIQTKIIQVQKMVVQLTELSKIEEVNFKPRKEPFVLSEIVQETVHTYQLIASEKKVDLKCTQCLYHVWIVADISMMERVIQNLIDNAIKHTLPGGKVQVSIAVQDEKLIFTIENTGEPLSAELIQWINSDGEELSERPSHSGLGLLIVKKILRLHDASLNACANTNKNIFSFKIPVVLKNVSA